MGLTFGFGTGMACMARAVVDHLKVQWREGLGQSVANPFRPVCQFWPPFVLHPNITAMAESYPYRVKFVDIRVKPPAKDKARRQATTARACEWDGCDMPGDHPAPKPGDKGRHWFCQEHAAQYNRNFNFFEGMSEAEIAAFNERARYGHKNTWRFGTGPVGGRKSANLHDRRYWRGADLFEDLDDRSGAPTPGGAPRGRTPLIVRALNELDLEADAPPGEIRLRYSEYVRRFHPDSNGGDRSSEHKLARVLRAGKTLKAAGLMKA